MDYEDVEMFSDTNDTNASEMNEVECDEQDDLARSNICKKCLTLCDPYTDPALTCRGDCERKVHIKCLNRGALPGGFAGDIFFHFECSHCSPLNEEIITREKMPWLTTIMLTLYNLKEKSFGISKKGYFHWKSDISTFVDRNWDLLFPKSVKQKKNWIGTISGTLSHYKGIFFTSGKEELDMGWWKLSSNDPPEILVERYNKILEENKQKQANNRLKRSKKLPVDPAPSEAGSSAMDTSMDSGIPTKIAKLDNMTNNEMRPSEDLPEDFLLRDNIDDIDIPELDTNTGSPMSTMRDLADELPFQNDDLSDILSSHWSNDAVDVSNNDVGGVAEAEQETEQNNEEVNDITEAENDEDAEDKNDEDNKDNDDDAPAEQDIPKSLFTRSVKRDPPWEKYYLKLGEIRPRMSEREEAYLLQKIKSVLEKDPNLIDTMTPKVRRLYRKLCVRQLRREYNLPVFDIDKYSGTEPEVAPNVREKGNGVLDRFCADKFEVSHELRLQGHNEPTSVHSPFTNRLLKPFIRRDTSSRPLWLRVMSELLAKVNGKDPNWRPPPLEPIDYSYIRPQHVPATNSLCSHFFWPGIDTTECLQYPDFTCVVLYKKLVIGFASLVPDTGYNEAYISFLVVRPEWRKAGIGTFMLYHLVQTCMGKDITLHVSATNPALVLYQKFGFKIQEFVQDFYDKYMDPFSKECRHALFLKLSR